MEKVRAELEKPMSGSNSRVSEKEIDKDAEAFMAFAGALGVTPPQ